MLVKRFVKFCSWNIEGLAGKLADEDFLSTIETFDCVSLVETWSSETDVNIEGFYSFSKGRQASNNARRNSGGITVLVKSELRKGVKFLDKESSEEFVWWKLEKDFFHMKRDLYVCTVYIPPQNSPRERRLNCDHFQLLQENIYKFSRLGEVMFTLGTRVSKLHSFSDTLSPNRRDSGGSSEAWRLWYPG